MEKQMTKERLKAYRSNLGEIKELEYKLAHLGEGDSMIGNDVVHDYRSGFPKPQAIVGYDHKKHAARQQAYERRIKKLREECEEIETWIERIPDSLTRRIFRMTFVDGMTLQKVGAKTQMDKSTVARKIDNYLNSQH